NYDCDIYSFEIEEPSKVTIDFTYPMEFGSRTAYDSILLTADSKKVVEYSLKNSHWDGSYVKGEAIYLPRGKFFIRVMGKDNWSSWGKEYSLKVTAQAGFVEQEFNNTFATANKLPLGKTI